MALLTEDPDVEQTDLGIERRETVLERCDRNLVELLQEVRVAQRRRCC